ncbi:Septin-2 [Eumeta japonica]|uniref:Septin-2 n=1 Tax=Eumeta variegata TaxID=151549 RepID=A0A4C1SRJ2_EUMVA|nr:Septin-2 [Eumeta japonica]
MCIGETGLGKSTLMDTLFNTSFESTPSSHTLPNVKLKAHTYELQESNVRLKLTICDTVGYGDQINKDDSFKAVVDYIDAQFEAYLQEELKIKRSLIACHDSRIHVCLYFICPTGHGLKSLDLVCMKKLDSKVNIIPIIAKADTISKVELQRFKSKIMQELANNGVHIYQFPTEDETVAETNSAMNDHVPFAVKRLEEMGFSDVDSDNKPISFNKHLRLNALTILLELQAKEEEVRQMFVQRVKEKKPNSKNPKRSCMLNLRN